MFDEYDDEDDDVIGDNLPKYKKKRRNKRILPAGSSLQ